MTQPRAATWYVTVSAVWLVGLVGALALLSGLLAFRLDGRSVRLNSFLPSRQDSDIQKNRRDPWYESFWA